MGLTGEETPEEEKKEEEMQTWAGGVNENGVCALLAACAEVCGGFCGGDAVLVSLICLVSLLFFFFFSILFFCNMFFSYSIFFSSPKNNTTFSISII